MMSFCNCCRCRFSSCSSWMNVEMRFLVSRFSLLSCEMWRSYFSHIFAFISLATFKFSSSSLICLSFAVIIFVDSSNKNPIFLSCTLPRFSSPSSHIESLIGTVDTRGHLFRALSVHGYVSGFSGE